MKPIHRILGIILFTFTTSLFATPNDDLLDSAKNGDLPKAETALKAGANITVQIFFYPYPLKYS